MKRILVTGGAGFIGSHLCRELLKDEDSYVIAADNLSTGRLCNIEPLLSRENFRFIEWDIQNALDIEVDRIYNAACPASPPAYQKSPVQTLKTCAAGTINMLELARKNNARLLQFSTSEVYGEPLVHPQVESYFGNVNPNGIRSCYDEGKRCAEALCFAYKREYGTDGRIVRIFNTYGPQMDPEDGRIISNFFMEALQNKDISIYGKGEQTRCFCYVSDTVRGLIAMMENPEDFMGPVNLGNPQEFSVLQMAEKIIALTGSKSRLSFHPLPKDDPTRRCPDISLAKERLNWQPQVSLEEGLQSSLEYFRRLCE